MAGFVLVFALVMAGEYLAFRRGFDELTGMRLAGAALTLYFVESLLVLILLISLVSFVASGIWIFYRAKDTPLLLAAPVPVGGLFALRAIETFLLTSWALAIVGLPALLALGRAYHRALDFYVSGAIVLVLFALLAAGLGALVTTLAAALLVRAPTRLAAGLVVVGLGIAFVGLVGKNVVPSTGDFYVIFEPGILNGKPSSIKFLEAKFWLWPSHPFAAALYSAATGGKAGSTGTRLLLWLAPAASIGVALTVGRALYARTLPRITESFTLGSPPATPRRAAPARFPRRLHGPVGALIERDVLSLARNPHELSRAGFIAFLLALYTSFVFIAPLHDVGDRPAVLGRLMLFNVAAAGYFLTALGLRFVFPSLSLEGRAAWVFFSSPISVTRLMLAKLALAIILMTVAVVPIAIVGTLRLVRDGTIVAAIAVLLLMLAVTTATLLLGAGAAWPNFREANPEALSTSGAGLLVTVVCLLYVAAMGWIARGVVLAHAAGHGLIPWLGTAILASSVLIAGSMVIAARRLDRLEAT